MSETKVYNVSSVSIIPDGGYTTNSTTRGVREGTTDENGVFIPAPQEDFFRFEAHRGVYVYTILLTPAEAISLHDVAQLIKEHYLVVGKWANIVCEEDFIYVTTRDSVSSIAGILDKLNIKSANITRKELFGHTLEEIE